jgi:hypothetical protein
MVAGAGCLNEDVVGTKTATGVYTLRTINNTQLPWTVPASGTTKTEILDAVVTLYQGGTYAETSHVRVTTNGVAATQTREDTGSYNFFGISVTMVSSAGNPERRGRIEVSTMTIVEEGKTSVYQK